MSHRIYTTPGFVTGSRPSGEGGRILFIFTLELGHILALAQGIRLEKSKLRYHAQDYSLADFSLVRGKEFWRIVGAEAIADSGFESQKKSKITTTDPAYALRVRILSVLSRLLQGEDKNEELFNAVHALHIFLTSESETPVTSETVEPIIMLRILNHLGYVRNMPSLAPFIADNSFSPELLRTFSEQGIRAAAIKEINAALKESQL